MRAKAARFSSILLYEEEEEGIEKMGFDCLLSSFKASVLGLWTKERDV